MPNRILREGILTSRRVNRLKPQAEVFYRRVMSVVDDFGRFSADPSLLRASCFPLRLDEVREADISRWLAEVQTARLIVLYAVDQEPYLEMLDFRQSKRALKSKFPSRPADAEQMSSTCVADAVRLRPEAEAYSETRDERREAGTAPPSPPRRPSPAAFLETWNRERGTLAEAKGLSPGRERKAKARLADVQDLERWAAAFRRAASSPFCRGENDRGWRATFDWFLAPDTLLKVEEGKYDPKGRDAPARTEAPDWRKRIEEEDRARAKRDLEDARRARKEAGLPC